MSTKKNVLFVGGFNVDDKTRNPGGLVLACTSLIESSLKSKFNFILINSSPKNNLKRSFVNKSITAAKRIIIFIYHLIFSKIDTVLIFSANDWSFKEKGLMSIIGKMFNKYLIFAPRAGAIKEEIETSRKLEIFARKVFSSADIILCQSKLWKDVFLKYAPDTRLEVIENWLDLENYSSSISSKFKRTSFLYLAWVIKTKGIYELIEAVKILNDEEYAFDLIVCGGGDDLEKIKKLCLEHKLSNVLFKGWVHGDTKIKYLKKSHIFISPSHFEGFSNSLLESMACGLPVISTPAGSAADIISHKENGLLIEFRNPKSIAKAMKYCLDHPYELSKISKEGKKRILENNILDKAVLGFQKILSPS